MVDCLGGGYGGGCRRPFRGTSCKEGVLGTGLGLVAGDIVLFVSYCYLDLQFRKFFIDLFLHFVVMCIMAPLGGVSKPGRIENMQTSLLHRQPFCAGRLH